jgi:hypothetical protein
VLKKVAGRTYRRHAADRLQIGPSLNEYLVLHDPQPQPHVPAGIPDDEDEDISDSSDDQPVPAIPEDFPDAEMRELDDDLEDLYADEPYAEDAVGEVVPDERERVPEVDIPHEAVVSVSLLSLSFGC